MSGVEAIVPAYNEERTIGAVIAAARACRLVDRVLVVDDGSTDRTADVARRAGARVAVHHTNMGKTAALLTGAVKTGARITILLDGDLLGLTPGHIEALVAPVLDGSAAMSIGVFVDGRWITDLSQRLTPFLNGQRAMRRELLQGLRGSGHRRYAADTLLSRYARRCGVHVEMVELQGLTHVMKEEKLGWVRGILSHLAMFYQVFLAFLIRLPGADPGSTQANCHET